MSRFLTLVFLFVVAAGAALHREIDFPSYGSWIGQLPGDLILKKGSITIFLPFTSAVLASGVLSFLLSFFSSSRK